VQTLRFADDALRVGVFHKPSKALAQLWAWNALLDDHLQSVLLAQNRDSDPNRDWIVYTYELNY
jgi:hypothetical protein